MTWWRLTTGGCLRFAQQTTASRRRAVAIFLALVLSGCHRDMRDQPRYETLEASELFADGQSARPVPAGTIARGQLQEDEAFYTGKRDGGFVLQVPVTIDRPLLERGQERFNIYCSPCHGRVATGEGMIVSRGFRRPPSFHIERLRSAPAGHFFDVMTHGFGAMPRYGAHVPPQDRWAIAAYIRVLQLSQHADLSDVPSGERSKLEEARP
jgi:cbb3-type cytochrome c oxidase subunit III